MTEKNVHYIQNMRGLNLALHSYLPSGVRHLPPVILAHGTFSDHRVCRGLASRLSDVGFPCWIYETQGHGLSQTPSTEPTLESMYLEDLPAVIAHVAATSRTGRVHWVGHSGGGLAILMYLARYPKRQALVQSFVTLASQTADAHIPFWRRLVFGASVPLMGVLGYAPGRFFKLGPQNEPASVMSQWCRWSYRRAWDGADGFDYFENLNNIRIPAYLLAGAGDTFIAPATGCRRIFELLGSEEKTFAVCGTQTGYSEEYTHARVLSSRNASKEIWPTIVDWLVRVSSKSS